jgi:hypothetical protein
MILLDWNGLAVGTIVTQKLDLDENMIRHVILNQLRMYNTKFRKDYGQMVICCEGRSWRKEVFPNYKASRKKTRDNDSSHWEEVFRIINMIRDEIKENLPYKVVQVERAEADDIIGTLAEYTNEFGKHEPVMIVSNDKDFLQLQKFSNIKQFSPMKKKLIEEKHPHKFLVEHIIKGDSSDGIPNILSGDDVFVNEDDRQKPVRQKFIDEVIADLDDSELLYAASWYRNYQRNKQLIDLSETPTTIKENIINIYESEIPAERKNLLNYLIAKRCKLLIESIEEFY